MGGQARALAALLLCCGALAMLAQPIEVRRLLCVCCRLGTRS